MDRFRKFAMSITLIASAPTMNGIKDRIRRYWFMSKFETLEVEDHTVVKNGLRIEGVRVVYKQGLFRFQEVQA
jgi:hypothetical protein